MSALQFGEDGETRAVWIELPGDGSEADVMAFELASGEGWPPYQVGHRVTIEHEEGFVSGRVADVEHRFETGEDGVGYRIMIVRMDYEQ